MKIISIPIEFFDSKYDGSKYPGSKNLTGLKNGANCQYFAYEFLRYFGYRIPDFRSSDLWEDKIYTKQIKSPRPLDILFFNEDNNSYGAHLGIYIGSNKVIHLSKEVGYPTVWDLLEFKKRERYKTLIGIKRMKNNLL